MPLIAAKCTNCGGILEVDSSKDAAICPFCNTPYVVEKAINIYQITNNVNADSIHSVAKSADGLFADAQTYLELGLYGEAYDRYLKMSKEFPADSELNQ